MFCARSLRDYEEKQIEKTKKNEKSRDKSNEINKIC